ncbi:hypothetical protein AC1031_012837 [Aphanomyces cochlioides]|nr:hypothetical protein AC1031_012837 [Aphanomyces cochlioides]
MPSMSYSAVDLGLRNRDLLVVIVAFQHGFTNQVLQLKQAMEPPVVARLYLIITIFDWSLKTVRGQGIWEHIKQFNKLCELWLATLSSQNDISRHLQSAPYMEDVLLVYAATTGNLSLLQRGFQHPDAWLTTVVNKTQRDLSTSKICRVLMDLAAWSGHVHIVDYIASQPLIESPFRATAGLHIARSIKGTFGSCAIFTAHGCQSDKAIEYAAAKGHYDVVHFLRSGPYRREAVIQAAENGHLECVKCLMENYQGDSRHDIANLVGEAAVLHGHSKIVTFLRDWSTRRDECTVR